MNEKTREKQNKGFNLFDVIIILLVLFVTVFGIYIIFFSGRAFWQIDAKGTKTEATYVFRIKGLDSAIDLEKCIKENTDKVSIEESDIEIGKAIKIEKLNKAPGLYSEIDSSYSSESLFEDDKNVTVNGTVYKKIFESDWEIAVCGDARYYEGKYLVNGVEVRIGSTVTLRTPYFSYEAECVSIDSQAESEENASVTEGLENG